MLSDIGDVLAAVELNRQALIVYTIKCGVNVRSWHNFQIRPEE
jgi:hypothetical protein